MPSIIAQPKLNGYPEFVIETPISHHHTTQSQTGMYD